MVGVIGSDFPVAEREFMESRGINLEGLEVVEGATFRWTGRYHENMNVRDTLDLQLNVFGDFNPKLPESYRDSDLVFLANIQPGLQTRVLSQLGSYKLVGADTMDHWIVESRTDLIDLLKDVDILSINDSEAELLSGDRNVVAAARKILEMGPKSLLIKRGEYGALLFSANDVFAVPAYPLETVVDPTGAGDCFAGGFMGHLARSGSLDESVMREAVVYGNVMGSFAVEEFSIERFLPLTIEDIERRYDLYKSMVSF